MLLSRGPDGALGRWHVALNDGTVSISRVDGPLAEPRVVARVAAHEARIEDGLWESELRTAGVSLPLSAGERAAVARLLAASSTRRSPRDRDLEWRERHLDELRAGRAPRRRIGLPTSTGTLTKRAWELLAPPDRHPILDRLGEEIWPATLVDRVTTDRDAGLSRRHQVDPASPTTPAARMFGEIARAFGVPCPRLFVRTDVRGGLVHMPVFPLASLSGNDVLRLADRELCLLLSAHVAAYRPESYLATVLPHPRSLATAFHAALRITGSVERSHAGVESLAEQLTRRLPPARVEALWMVARQLSIDLPPAELHDVLVAAAERWLFAVAKTQARAGLLLCDELGTALDVFAQIGPPWNARSLLEDLERFWVSEELSRLRAALGR